MLVTLDYLFPWILRGNEKDIFFFFSFSSKLEDPNKKLLKLNYLAIHLPRFKS